MGLFEGRDSGFWWKRGARFGIVILNGRETGFGDFTNRDSGNDTFLWDDGSKMYKENQAVIFVNAGNSRTKGLVHLTQVVALSLRPLALSPTYETD